MTGEITSPSKILPRVLNHAMAIVISLSVLANVSFYVVLPLETLRGTNAIALVRAKLFLTCETPAVLTSALHRILETQSWDEQVPCCTPGSFVCLVLEHYMLLSSQWGA